MWGAPFHAHHTPRPAVPPIARRARDHPAPITRTSEYRPQLAARSRSRAQARPPVPHAPHPHQPPVAPPPGPRFAALAPTAGRAADPDSRFYRARTACQLRSQPAGPTPCGAHTARWPRSLPDPRSATPTPPAATQPAVPAPCRTCALPYLRPAAPTPPAGRAACRACACRARALPGLRFAALRSTPQPAPVRVVRLAGCLSGLRGRRVSFAALRPGRRPRGVPRSCGGPGPP